jgi:hypothetical protein
MKPRLAPLQGQPASIPEPITLQQYYHGEVEQAVKAVIASFGEFVTLKTIARSLNCTSEYVRVLLRDDPNLKMIAGKWQVTRARAARFIEERILAK